MIAWAIKNTKTGEYAKSTHLWDMTKNINKAYRWNTKKEIVEGHLCDKDEIPVKVNIEIKEVK